MTKTWTIKITKESIKNAAKKAWTNVRTFKMTFGKFAWIVTALWAADAVGRGFGVIEPSQLSYTIEAILITWFLAKSAKDIRKAEKAKKEKAE